MNTQITLDNLAKLKLHGMAKVYQGIIAMPVHERPSPDQLMARLAEAEIQERAHKKTQMFLKVSRLRYNAVLENIYCSAQRNFTKDNLLAVADCSFIERSENILITGATGCGKSYLACALGRQACTLGYKTAYFGMARFLERVAQSKLDGTYAKFINYLDKTKLIVLDDFGLHPLDTVARLALLQVMEDAYGKRSVIVTSQLPVSKWHGYLDDPTIADAIMDRLAVNASRIELGGPTLRKKN
jgi:DNA replication protein DnaC